MGKMRRYDEQVKDELLLYSNLENKFTQVKNSYLNKLLYLLFIINGSGATVLFSIGGKYSNLESGDLFNDLALGNRLHWFIMGIVASIVSILIQYYSSRYQEIYARRNRGYKEIQLKAISMFHDFLCNDHYCDIISPFSGHDYYENIGILQRRIAELEEMRSANYYNMRCADKLEDTAVTLCIISSFFFTFGLTNLTIGSSRIEDFINFLEYTACFIYFMYELVKICKLAQKRDELYQKIENEYSS
jgi:hypothetical protein